MHSPVTQEALLTWPHRIQALWLSHISIYFPQTSSLYFTEKVNKSCFLLLFAATDFQKEKKRHKNLSRREQSLVNSLKLLKDGEKLEERLNYSKYFLRKKNLYSCQAHETTQKSLESICIKSPVCQRVEKISRLLDRMLMIQTELESSLIVLQMHAFEMI